MSQGLEDQPPASGSGPILNWTQEIARQAGPSPTTASIASVPGSAIEDKPPETSVKNDELHPEVVADMQHNRGLREKYADRAYQLAFGCLWWWGLMLSAQGIVNICLGNPPWSDKVIIAVTTGVTVSVLAAFLGVIRGLFGNGSLNGKDKK